MEGAQAAIGLIALLVVSLDTADSPSGASRWVANARRSQVVVHVYRKGLLSGMAHDHHFHVGEFRATAVLDPAGPDLGPFEVVADAGSLRDRQPDLTPDERARVDAQAAGDDVLDAHRFPEVRLVPARAGLTRLRSEPDGSLAGELAAKLVLHGKERAVTVPIAASREGGSWRARGTFRFRQSDFGIEPYSGFLGMVAVHDEVQVDFDVRLEEERR